MVLILRAQPPQSLRQNRPQGQNVALNVLYHDNHLLVVHKPPGMLTQQDRTGDPCVLDLARAWLKETFARPGNVFVGMVHRLDRPVGGVLVLARTSKAAARLSAQLRERTVRKIYRAEVHGIPDPPDAILEAVLDDKPCRLGYRTLRGGDDRALLEVEPTTGRKHQIRRQLAGIGHPIVGDLRYGAPAARADGQIALYAWRITIVHPTRGETLTFEAPLPAWARAPGQDSQRQ